MKLQDFSFAIIADQVSSRSETDRVPAALAALADLPVALPFERTAGDEVQGLATDPATVVAVVGRLTRLEGWRVGIGVGFVELPLPDSTRAARGSAYLAARAAVAAARRRPTGLALETRPDVGGDRYGGMVDAATHAESALWLYRSLLHRRSEEGWELMDLLDRGLTNTGAATFLGISPSAVSQRLARAGRTEARRGESLCAHLLTRLQEFGGSGAGS